MQLRIEPTIDRWPTPTVRRPIWTGHQATLWHPGIWAKYEVAAAVARRAGVEGPSGAAQVLVDQDVYDPLTLRVPVREGDRLAVRTVRLGGSDGPSGVAVGMRPPVRSAVVAAGLKDWPAGATVRPDIGRWMTAFSEAQVEAETLAQQLEGVMARLLPGGALAKEAGRPTYGGGVPASSLMQGEDDLLEAMRTDAKRCAGSTTGRWRSTPPRG